MKTLLRKDVAKDFSDEAEKNTSLEVQRSKNSYQTIQEALQHYMKSYLQITATLIPHQNSEI